MDCDGLRDPDAPHPGAGPVLKECRQRTAPCLVGTAKGRYRQPIVFRRTLLDGCPLITGDNVDAAWTTDTCGTSQTEPACEVADFLVRSYSHPAPRGFGEVASARDWVRLSGPRLVERHAMTPVHPFTGTDPQFRSVQLGLCRLEGPRHRCPKPPTCSSSCQGRVP
jgi:hypothetical protein